MYTYVNKQINLTSFSWRDLYGDEIRLPEKSNEKSNEKKSNENTNEKNGQSTKIKTNENFEPQIEQHSCVKYMTPINYFK